MYTNHSLKESQFFRTEKSLVKIFYKVLMDSTFINNTEINLMDNTISLSESFVIEKEIFKINVTYENNPISLRKIGLSGTNINFNIGFFQHKLNKNYNRGFFSLISPYLNN